MAVGLVYLTAKAAEYTATIDWVASELLTIANLPSEHPRVAQELDKRIAEARGRISLLRRIVQLNRPTLIARGVSIINELQYDILVLSENYLPALKKEGTAENEFGRVVLRAAQRCGLANVQEIVVNLSGGHAVIPTLLSCPLMFAPPHQRHTLLDLPAIYHEFGHVVIGTEPEIGNRLVKTLADYFRELELAAGSLTPDKRQERRRQIREAQTYWFLPRLEELFCDIFATYATGPAHYYSSVDMAMRHRQNPYEIDMTDEHPPLAARVWVCKAVLLPEQRNSEVGQQVSVLWDEHVRGRASSSQFKLFCRDELLERLVKESVGTLTRLRRFHRYSGTGHHPKIAAEPDVNLEELLNESVRMLFRDAATYAAWERPFIDLLFQ
jgi:hypothetical protein